MSEIKPPQAVVDVYRDLRDRHLLLPAIALLVGLVAVPMLLKGSDEPVPPPVPVAAAPASDSQLSAAVLADDSVSVRNYRKRLAALKSKNPFREVFKAPPAPSDDAAASATSGSGAATSTSPSSSSSSASSSSTGGAYPTETGTASDPTTSGGETTTTDENGGNGNGGNGGNGGNEPSGQDVDVVNHLVTRRVDLTIGLEGDPKLRENVKPMTILPDPATPVVAYLGTDEKGKRAAFVVAKEATLAGGTAACVPAPENCLYITLQKNETATLDFGPDGQVYELRLLEIRDVELKAE